MAQKKRLKMRGVKHSSKRLEDEMLDKSRALSDNPGILRPSCAGGCRKCVFDKPFKQIDGLHKIKNDPDALVKEASRFGGDDIVRAYAGTVSLAAAGSVPLLASGKLGGETVSYAVRGTVNATKLIGCQYYDDPKRRLLLYSDYVKKHKLHLYSFGDCLVCSDRPNMPEDYLYDVFWETPYEFPNDGLSCGHESSAALEIHVKSLDETISICEDCAKDIPTLAFVVSRLAAVDPLDDIEVRVRHKYHSAGGNDAEIIAGDRLKEYMSGKIGDSILIDSVKRSKLGDLKGGSSATYIIGSKNYGSDLDAFLGDLEGSGTETDALKAFLKDDGRAIVIRTPKASEALSAIWQADWKGIVAAYTDRTTADKMGDLSKRQPSSVLEEAYNIFVSADVVAALPVFTRPGPVTQLADVLAKAAKVGGYAMVAEAAAKASLKNNALRSMAGAFMLASGSEPSLKLSREEMELSKYLEPFARKVIDSTGEKYRDAMATLLVASGSNEKVS